MDIDSLRYFDAIATEKSFSRASERLFVTQPTLSRHIQSLERELGCRLLVRDTHSVDLTEEGQHCLEYARAILANVERMKQLGGHAALGGALQIGYVSAVENLLVTTFVRALRHRFPEIRVVVTPGDPSALREKFEASKLDIVYLPYPTAATLRGTEHVTLVRQGLRALIPREHPLAAKASIRFADLSGQTLISFRPESGREIYEAILRLLQEHHVQPREVLFIDSVEQIAMMVEAGEGISLHASIGTLDAYGVVVRPIEDCQSGFDVLACWKKKNANPALRQAVRLLGESVRG